MMTSLPSPLGKGQYRVLRFAQYAVTPSQCKVGKFW